MKKTKRPQKDLRNLSRKLGLDIPGEKLRDAFYHSSYVNEREDKGGGPEDERERDRRLRSNERLEFLGDAVIELSVSSYLYRNLPERDEGELSRIKSIVVSQPVLSTHASELNLGDYLYLGKGEAESGGREKDSILCDVFEALVGVIFRERGFERTAQFVTDRLKGDIVDLIEKGEVLDYKSALQIEAQDKFDHRPTYQVLEAEGKSHRRVYSVEAQVGDYKGVGRGRSKKEAEQAAAKQVYLKVVRDSDSGA